MDEGLYLYLISPKKSKTPLKHNHDFPWNGSAQSQTVKVDTPIPPYYAVLGKSMDLTACEKIIRQLKEQSLFRSLRRVDPEPSALPGRAFIDGRSVILMASNNYLGLAEHPRIKEAAIRAIGRYGMGSGASRLISGNTALHEVLETRIAEFKKTEAALVFSTGYMANLGLLSSLLPSKGLLIADRLCHASLIDGCRLSGCRLQIYGHRNLEQLEKLLKRRPPGRPTLIVTDGVFSMDGDIAPLPELVKLSERYGATVFLDDAHATGVIGHGGRGTPDHFGMASDHVIQMGTLGKALGGFGAYIAGSRDLIHYLVNKAKPFIYTTAPPPSVMAAAIAALEVMESEPERLDQLWKNRAYYAQGLKALGLNTLGSETPIIPIFIGDSQKALRFSERLLEAGIYAPAIRPPTVPKGTSRLRTTVMATHTHKDLNYVLETIDRTARSLEILS